MIKQPLSFSIAPFRAVSVALLIALAGCGGGGKSLTSPVSPSANRAQGSVHFTIRWPEPSRLIPSRAQKITLKLMGDDGSSSQSFAAVLGEKDIVRPTTDVTFPNMPIGEARLTATAYPDTSSGSTTAQATGTAPVTIEKNKTAEVHVTMASTIARVAVTLKDAANPTDTVSVKLHQSREVTATAYDADGSIVLTNPTNWQWSSKDPATIAVTGHGETATITGAGGGVTDLTVQETESTVSGTSKAQVATYEIVELTPPDGAVSTDGQCLNDNGAVFGTAGVPFDENNTPLGIYPHPHPVFWSSPDAAPLDFDVPVNALHGATMNVRAVGLNNSGLTLGEVDARNNDYTRPDESLGNSFISTSGGNVLARPYVPFILGNGTTIPDEYPKSLTEDGHALIFATATTYIYGGHSNVVSTAVDIIPTDLPPDVLQDPAKVRAATITLDLMSVPVAMNNKLQVIGYAPSYSGGGSILIDAHSPDSATSLPTGMEPVGINDAGSVIGVLDTKPVIWQGGIILNQTDNLPLLDGDTSGRPVAINGDGWVVGTSGSHFALWKEGKVYDLASLVLTDQGWTFTDLHGINARGQIVGTGLRNGKLRGFVLTPIH